MLLTIFSTLAQPSFDDTEPLTDTSTVSLGINRTASESEGLTDTILVTRMQAANDNIAPTDTMSTVQNFISNNTDNSGSVDTFTTLQNFVTSMSDTSGSTDNTAINQNIIRSDTVTFTDTASLNIGKTNTDLLNEVDTFSVDIGSNPTDSLPLSETLVFDYSVVFTDGSDLSDSSEYNFNVITFDGSSLSDTSSTVQNFERTFTESDTIFSDVTMRIDVVLTDGAGNVDTFVPTREVFFSDNTKPTDNFKKVKSSGSKSILVEQTELRWDLE